MIERMFPPGSIQNDSKNATLALVEIIDPNNGHLVETKYVSETDYLPDEQKGDTRFPQQSNKNQ